MVKRKYGPQAPWYKFWKNIYLTVPFKYVAALLFATLWAAASIDLAQDWAHDLDAIVNFPWGWVIIFGIAIVPGFMNGFGAMSLLLDLRPRRKQHYAEYPDITILVAAYNEENGIESTIASIARQGYPGNMTTIVVSDGSKDKTVAKVRALMTRYPWLGILDINKNVGKSVALTQALNLVKSDIVITVDGDTYLYKNALRNIVERYMSDPVNTRAVAGAILVRNYNASICTRMQTFDYFIGIAGVKKLQSMYHGTLVAQGAFSLYDTATVRELGGWPHTVGEDIVLTWVFYAKDIV